MDTGRGRFFREVDYSRPQTTASEQEQALSSATDAPQANTQPTSSDTGHWSGKLPEGVDASWVRNAIRLIGRENVGSFEDLADPEHRKWVRRKMRKAKREQKQAAPPPPPEEEEVGDGEESAPEPAPPPKPTESRIVRLSGRLPRGRMVDRPVALAAPGGYVPAGEGLWWPPYPTTGGPIARPEFAASPTRKTDLSYTLSAADQAAALEGGR